MSKPILADDLAALLDDVRRRLEILERTARLPNVSTIGQQGVQFGEVVPEESTTSTAYTDLATVGPEVTVKVGPTGRLIVMAGAYLTSTVTNQTVFAGVSLDGGTPFDMAVLGNNTSGSVAGDHSSATLLTGVAAGAHTLRMKYGQSLGGATGRFGARWLMAMPY